MSKNIRKCWARLGVAFDEAFSAKGAIDLERLLIDTCREGRKDSRLFFAMRGWLLKHHDLVNASRLIRMVKKEKETAVMGALIDSIVEREPRSNLRYVAKYCKTAGKKEIVFDEIRASKTICRLNEEENLSIWRRWNLVSRDMESPDRIIAEKGVVLGQNSNLALRALFGPGMRAEILNYLIENGEGNAHKIAKTICMSYEPVYSELKQCERIGLIKSTGAGRARTCRFKKDVLRKTLARISHSMLDRGGSSSP